ncbi:putative late blight resistance protein homolog R1B-16 [Henckelia pumila]|uniref:putative late blight resistance protein homolog R1B-16 n=1 Tax=Henckelia pumila TaxID=405737 RepID=UPI003C6E5F97
MRGIGKTTFAWKLFDDSLIVCQYDIRAWVTVSQEYQMREIFAGLLDSTNQLSSEIRKLSGGELADRLYKSLKGRKYIIVMDDVWDTKIVLTTRHKIVGDDAASFDHRHDMRPLDSGESWDLFRAKVFRGGYCPPRLEGIGLEIVKKCRGLPLSIVVIGSLLSMDKTVGYWETIVTALKSILSTDGGQCSTIFSLSYNYLPAHLKPCFLYFAIFPKDHAIRRSNLIHLWVAEGFIKPNGSKSLEDIAEECLEDLLNRSLIMVLKLGRDGKVKTYRIHDLLRDFCITEAKKEKFFHVTNKYSIPYEGIRSERRVSINPVSHLESIEHAFNSNGPPSTTRSLVLYDEDAEIIVSEPSFGLLRVLDMKGGKLLIEFPKEIALPPNFKFLAALKKLTLSHCGLGWKDLTMVGSLPNLEVLKLNDEACEGGVWEPNEGEFRMLKSLELNYLDLVEWRADDSHFPQLECLKIRDCWKLKEILTEIENIPTLEKIELEGECSSSAVAFAKLILDQQLSLGNDVLQVRIF